MKRARNGEWEGMVGVYQGREGEEWNGIVGEGKWRWRERETEQNEVGKEREWEGMGVAIVEGNGKKGTERG